jgi:hypothetical protein
LSALLILAGISVKRSIEASQREGVLFADRIVIQGFVFDPKNKAPITLVLPASRQGQWVFDQEGTGIGCTGGYQNRDVSPKHCEAKFTPRTI